MVRRLIILLLILFSMTFISCAVFYDLIFTPSPVFIMNEVNALISGELILSGTFGEVTLDREGFDIEQTLYGQLRYIETSFRVSKYSVDFYWLELAQLDIRVMMWFSKSSNSGYNARFRLYEESGASDTFLQLEKPVLRMVKSDYNPLLQSMSYFIAGEDYVFIKDDYTKTDIILHKSSYLEFTDYRFIKTKEPMMK